MKNNRNLVIRSTIYVALIFFAMMVVLVSCLDLLASPILRELLLEPYQRNWCGIFSRCASGTQRSFIEHLQAGAPWTSWDLVATETRLKKAALLGAFIGVGYVAIAAFQHRRR